MRNTQLQPLWKVTGYYNGYDTAIVKQISTTFWATEAQTIKKQFFLLNHDFTKIRLHGIGS